MVFLNQKADGNMIFTDYWKVLVLTFSEMENTVFSWSKKLTKILYLQITGKFLFWTFCDGKYGLSFSQKVDGNMIFTWSFWAFYDIPGPGKYGFSRSVICCNLYPQFADCRGYLMRRNVDNQEQIVILDVYFLGGWLSWRLFDYCWGRGWKKAYKHLNLLEMFLVRTLVSLVLLMLVFQIRLVQKSIFGYMFL